ncbi:hypothetical protein NQ318_016024 [Aromia moschata]|uniref:Uncharacterized protein n=1 Tax=Aromia moschata TaxID=1265417 RepID=A0AAV8XNG2_9CUCU|nr:hypothetical protein NQ318_016024 [Aromia moschata]
MKHHFTEAVSKTTKRQEETMRYLLCNVLGQHWPSLANIREIPVTNRTGGINHSCKINYPWAKGHAQCKDNKEADKVARRTKARPESVKERKLETDSSHCTAQKVEEVRQIVNEHPQTPIRRLSQQVNVFYRTCNTILKYDQDMHAYRLSSVHELLPNDQSQRMQFSEWFMGNLYNNENVFIKPCLLTRHGFTFLKVGVWVAISKTRLIGPILFERAHNLAEYHNEILENFVNALDNEYMRQGYFQQAGAPIHWCTKTATVYDNFLLQKKLVSCYL